MQTEPRPGCRRVGSRKLLRCSRHALLRTEEAATVAASLSLQSRRDAAVLRGHVLGQFGALKCEVQFGRKMVHLGSFRCRCSVVMARTGTRARTP